MAIISPLPYTLTNGTVADATQVMADFNEILNDVNANAAKNGANSDITSLSALSTPLSVAQGGTGGAVMPTPIPGGRLTLTSGTPVLTADVAAATSVYWSPYVSDKYPWYSGSSWLFRAPGELTLALDSNAGHTGYQQSGKNFDLFLTNDAGTDRLVTGPAWSTDVARGTGAGTTELQRLNGILTNKNSMTARFDTSASTLTVGVNQGTYVGSMRATANGQTSVVVSPAAASGGALCTLGLWNLYNKVVIRAFNNDNGAAYNYTLAAIRQARGSTDNQINFISGVAIDSIFAHYSIALSTTANAGALLGAGLGLDSITAIDTNALIQTPAAAIMITKAAVTFNYPPQIGYHYIAANEFSDGAHNCTFGSGAAASTGMLFAQISG